MPEKEGFIYPASDMPFLYTSWFFGVIYYVSYLLFNVYGVTLLKATVITAGFYILLKDSVRPFSNYIVSIIVMTLIVIACRHRFVERPDTFMLFFWAFSIFSLNAYLYEGKKYYYLLPFTHLIWANSHSSIIIMLTPFLSFIIGGSIHRIMGERGFDATYSLSHKQIKNISLIFIICIASSFINPNFLKQFIYGFETMSTDWFWGVDELQSPTWEKYKSPYIISAIALISFILNWKRFSLIHFMLLFPFLILGLTSKRYMFLLAITAGPIISRNLSSFFGDNSGSKIMNKQLAGALCALWLFIYSILCLTNTGVFAERDSKFGFGFDFSFMPEKALTFMDRNNISGKVLNQFHWGPYITWRDFPERKVFIDHRGYIPLQSLKKLDLFSHTPLVLDELYNSYGFDSILIEVPLNSPDILKIDDNTNWSLTHRGWALVYWDDISLLYLKREGKYQEVIKENEYNIIKPGNGLNGIRSTIKDRTTLYQMIDELTRNINETGSSKAQAFLGTIYNEMGLYESAIKAFSKVEENHLVSHLADAYNGIAYAYFNSGQMKEAINFWQKSLDYRYDERTAYSLGSAHYRANNIGTAEKYFLESIRHNGDFLPAYRKLRSLYLEQSKKKDAKKIEKLFTKKRSIEISEKHLRNGIKALSERKYDVAFEEYSESIRANTSNPDPFSEIGMIHFNAGSLKRAFQYQQKSLSIDPFHTDALYRMALIYKKIKHDQMAKEYFERYMHIDPRGKFSTNVKSELKNLGHIYQETRS